MVPYETTIFHGLGGGFKHFLFSTLLGEDIHFDYFSEGLKPPTIVYEWLIFMVPWIRHRSPSSWYSSRTSAPRES